MMKTKLKYVLIAAMGLSVMGGCKAPSLTPDEAVRLPEMLQDSLQEAVRKGIPEPDP